ncbi:PadR family transcriptional regulator [Paenibacillus sp. WLX1005]|uniref:PadR family transcriptional regulator n=1 Tax=Paenibacillus sp. WLX1005 TaxID=3243766 RepID=UPI0039840799
MYIDLLILDQISQAPRYGYEIKKTIQQQLDVLLDVNNNMLYPALQRFEKQGAVIKEVQRQEGKPSRNMYRITELGEQLLRELLLAFDERLARNELEFMIRVHLFDRLEPVERLRILHLRRVFVADMLEHVQRNRQEEKRSLYAREVSRLGSDMLERELSWIDQLLQWNENL